jgi:sporulation protein YlmC with PRC-barrel domain
MANAKEPRGLRDEANVGPDPRHARNLIPMHELSDFKVADGEPDIRGWRVYSSTGREVGVVQDLLVDTTVGEVVMLDIDLRRNDRHTLAPVRAAWIDRPTERVVIDSAQLDADEAVPALPRRGAVSDDDVRAFDDRYRQAYGDRGYDADRDYRVRRESDELRFGRRGPGTGTPTMGTAAVDPAGPADSADVGAAADRRTFDRDRGDRDVGTAALSSGDALEPDVLDAQTRAGIEAHPHGDRYTTTSERVVERHPRADDETARSVSGAGDTGDAGGRHVRYPKSVEDAEDERRRRVLEEVVLRRREVDPRE